MFRKTPAESTTHAGSLPTRSKYDHCKSIGNEINTNIGVPQGDCLSPILFIVYLAEALKPTRSIATPSYVEDHRYSQFSIRLLMIDQ